MIEEHVIKIKTFWSVAFIMAREWLMDAEKEFAYYAYPIDQYCAIGIWGPYQYNKFLKILFWAQSESRKCQKVASISASDTGGVFLCEMKRTKQP